MMRDEDVITLRKMRDTALANNPDKLMPKNHPVGRRGRSQLVEIGAANAANAHTYKDLAFRNDGLREIGDP